MVSRFRIAGLLILMLCFLVTPVAGDPVSSQEQLVAVTLTADADDGPGTLSGRILLTAQDGGILLEERNGTLHNLSPHEFSELQKQSEPFRPFDGDELAADLVDHLGSGFGIQQTEHFVIATDASEVWAEHCAELLEKVYDRYFEFCEDVEITVTPPNRPLAVILFRRQEQLQAHARQQHPETTFENVPGYYSSKANQIYATDVSGGSARSSRGLLRILRKHPRHTETIVHETVHLLGYNTGLHTRQADNPLWFTEGLAAWFEPVSGRGRLLWTGPGRPNAVYLRHLKAQRLKNRLPLRPQQLIEGNQLFLKQETITDAYACSWALIYTLLRRDQDAFARLASVLQQRQPLREYNEAAERETFAKASDTALPQLEIQAASNVRRLRVPSR